MHSFVSTDSWHFALHHASAVHVHVLSSRSWKATRNSALADHETDRVLRSHICLMEEQILQLEELNERVSTIQDVVAQLDGKS